MRSKIANKTVFLTGAVAAAVASCFFAYPNTSFLLVFSPILFLGLYIQYFLLCTVEESHIFYAWIFPLVARLRSVRAIALLLFAATYLLSMLFSEEISILLLMPITFLVFSEKEDGGRLLFHLLVLESIAGTLGEILSLSGSFHNLYLYLSYSYRFPSYYGLQLPFSILGFMFLLFSILSFQKLPEIHHQKELFSPGSSDYLHSAGYRILFLTLLLLLFSARLVPMRVSVPMTAGMMLLYTFCFRKFPLRYLLYWYALMVIFQNLSVHHGLISFWNTFIYHREAPLSMLLSIPLGTDLSTLLLSPFTTNGRQLLVGTNLGGLLSIPKFVIFMSLIRRMKKLDRIQQLYLYQHYWAMHLQIFCVLLFVSYFTGNLVHT